MSKQERFDVIVVGLGAAGSSALYQLARRGAHVLGIDQFDPPHALGSTHGDTRITRQALGEGAHYTPMSLRSYEIFREIEQETGERLLDITGMLLLSSSAGTGVNQVANFFENTIAAAKKHSIAYDVLDAAQMRTKFPQFNVQDREFGYFEPEAGLLRPEACVRATLAMAKRSSASVKVNERMIAYWEDNSGVVVETDKGKYRADKIVLAMGPWLPQSVGNGLQSRFKVYRQVLFWFDVQENYEQFKLGNMPVFIWDGQGVRRSMYGFPAVDGKEGGIKIAAEEYVAEVTPQDVVRTVSQSEIERMYEEQVRPCFPSVGKDCVKSAVCMYTMTADSGFVIDYLPESSKTIVCSPCSGHGFKHSAAVGECVAELARDGKTTLDIEPLRISSETRR